MKLPPFPSRPSFLRPHLFFAVAGILGSGAVPLVGQPAPTPAGQHAAAGRDPAAQAEGDWVDNRWNRTDVGPFLASTLEIPGGRFPKGLAIRLGERGEGAVSFDTESCVLRAGWFGGFLKFDATRFGLLRAPMIDGDIAFAFASNMRLAGFTPRYGGLHLNGRRVVLEYTINERRVLDSPWIMNRDGLKALTRSMEFASSAAETKLVVGPGGTNVTVASDSGVSRAVIQLTNNLVAMTVIGGDARLANEGGQLILRVPASGKVSQMNLRIWTGDKAMKPKFDALELPVSKLEDLQSWLNPGPARWLPELTTEGQRGPDTDILAVDTLTVPYDNPWKALMFLSGVDFTPDGAAYVSTIHGDVWRVTGLDDQLGKLHWKRFATGLFQPLGLKVRDGQVYVLGRDQITRLRDLNGDGEADFYENFCNLTKTSTGGHEYVTSLEKDDAGNFYFVDPQGAHRVSPDGRKLETLATGFRNPNGLGASPDGKIITVAPQQGNWTPSSAICEIMPGGYYGYGGPKITSERPLGYDAPLCWIPHAVDNSSGSQVWVPPNLWGPLGGQMLHLLWGRCGLMLVLRDAVDGVPQGAVVPLPGRFLSGPQRGTFNPRDGHLYIAGSTGWQTSALKDGALQRVRFTGKSSTMPIGWHAQENGITLKFTQPLDRTAAQDPGSYGIHKWNYRYAAQYGSMDWSVADPEKEGHDEVMVKSARLMTDGTTVFLEIPGLRPVMQMEIKYNLNAADGKPLRSQFWLTVNRVGSK